MNAPLSAQQVGLLWDPERLGLTETQRQLLPGLIRWLDRSKADPFSHAVRGRAVHGKLAVAEREVIARRVIARFRPLSTGVEALRIVCKVVDLGNETGLFDICPPPVPVLIRRQPSPFAEDRWVHHGLAQRLRNHLADSLKAPIRAKLAADEDKSARIEVGRAMLSAILHGGVLHEEVVVAIAQSLALHPESMTLINGRVFFDLPLGYRGQGNAEFRRWFPDELTAVLMARLDRSSVRRALGIPESSEATESLEAGNASVTAGFSRASIWTCIRNFLRASGLPAEAVPKSLHALRNAVLLDLETRLPPVLTNYAARNYVSHSLKSDVWARINGLPRQVPATSPVEKGKDEPSQLKADLLDTSEPEPRWLRAIRDCCALPTREAIIEALNEKLNKSPRDFGAKTNGGLFARFALHVFAHRNEKGTRLAVSTAKAYAISVAKRLPGIMGLTLAVELTGPEWIEIYKDALDDAETQGTRRKLARILWKFHAFLEREFDIDPVNPAEALGIGPGLVPVDANIITPDEFIAIRECFARELATGPLAGLEKIVWLLVTLTYRCGLRRMEVLKLELRDICLAEPAELLVRPTEARRLKTKNATRKLPLHALLDADELKRLAEFVETRRTEELSSPFSDFLFAAPQRKFKFIPQDTLFDALHAVMREVTGDQALRFHHLRHSFASWVFYRLMIADHPAGSVEKGFGVETQAFVQQAVTFRAKLYGNSLPTRRHGYAVTTLLGHSGPDISFEHYVHTVDLVLAHYLMHDASAPDRASVIAGSGLPSTTANRIWKQGATTALVQYFLESRLPANSGTCRDSLDVDIAIKGSASAVSTAPSVDQDAVASIDRVWRMLVLHGKRKLTAKDLSERYGEPESVIQGFLSRGQLIADLRYRRAGSSYRHRMMTWAPDERDSETRVRLPAPVKPSSERDLAILGELAPRIRALRVRNPGLLNDVLQFYLENADRDSNVLIFKDPAHPQDALRYLEFLEEIDIKRSMLRFICYDASRRSRVWPLWQKALSIDWRDRQDCLPRPNGRAEKGLAWAGIQPLFESDDENLEGSPALRYLLIMSAIEFG
jgi:integrase